MFQLEGTMPRSWPGKVSAPEFEFQIATSPFVALRQRMSALPSPLKSPTPWICQLEGTKAFKSIPVKPPEPFEFQIATSPFVAFRHRMSALPSPLKSPTPWICQLEGTHPKYWKKTNFD